MFIVEYRHISGMLFNADRESLSFLEELRIIREIIDDLQKTTPHFQFKLVLTGLKIVGKAHIDKMLRHIKEGVSMEDKRLVELIAGFDMVNEEDYTAEISVFTEEILSAKQQISIEEEEMPCFFHCGETHSRTV